MLHVVKNIDKNNLLKNLMISTQKKVLCEHLYGFSTNRTTNSTTFVLIRNTEIVNESFCSHQSIDQHKKKRKCKKSLNWS